MVRETLLTIILYLFMVFNDTNYFSSINFSTVSNNYSDGNE